MSIRWKLLILLLLAGLGPLGIGAAFRHYGTRQLGRELAENVRDSLTGQTIARLHQLIRDDAGRLRRDSQALEHTLRAQARAVERCLADAHPSQLRVWYAEDYDRGVDLPPDLAPSEKHYRFPKTGPAVSIPVTYSAQVFKLAPGVSRQDVASDVARLAAMTDEYRFLYEGLSNLIYWQFTALEDGVHSSYPGHGGYPADFDPRRREWYLRAEQENQLGWIGPYFDASSEQMTLTASMPVHRPDGSFAGVTGLDVAVADVVQEMELSGEWPEGARAMLVVIRDDPKTSTRRAAVIARPGYHRETEPWNTRVESEWLEADDPTETASLIQDMASGREGGRHTSYRGRDSLWVYGPVGDRGTWLVVIVPYDEVVAPAAAAEQEVLRRTRAQLRGTGGIALLVVFLVVVGALVGSRAVTRPVRELAATADRIAEGDLDAHARVETRDEIGSLARSFNSMVPQLRDRLRLKQSLALAMEVQQHLLPSEPPRIDGLDVAGQSIYCDETGGDYYDFIDLSEFGPRQLGAAIGDVTGHGIAAAMMMATARALLRSRATEPGSLSAMMNDLNRNLAADMVGGRFMTFFYLVLDSATRQARWASAGHDPAITYDPASDTFGELAGGDPPLGIDPDWQYGEFGPATLSVGQIVVLGTDGIWEARNPQGEFFGKEALRDVIRRYGSGLAREISDAITRDLAAFRRDRPQEDDVTHVVIRLVDSKANGAGRSNVAGNQPDSSSSIG